MAEPKFGYAINAWGQPLVEESAVERPEQQERVFKVLSACKFRAVELDEGSGRWAPLGRREEIEIHFGTVPKFRAFLRSCGIDRICSWFYDPARGSNEEGSNGRSPLVVADHQGIVDSTRAFAQTLQELGGSCLVVRPTPSYWRVAPVTDDKLKAAADCWNQVGRMSRQYDVQTAVHPDFLSALRPGETLDRFLSYTDPDLVGLAIDTAEVTIAGGDSIALYERYPQRVKHFHFKNARTTDSLGEYQTRNAEFEVLSAGGKRGIQRWFWDMGTPGGLVDFPRLVKSLQSHGYDGWIVVEGDQSPDPAATTALNAYYLQRVLFKS